MNHYLQHRAARAAERVIQDLAKYTRLARKVSTDEGVRMREDINALKKELGAVAYDKQPAVAVAAGDRREHLLIAIVSWLAESDDPLATRAIVANLSDQELERLATGQVPLAGAPSWFRKGAERIHGAHGTQAPHMPQGAPAPVSREETMRMAKAMGYASDPTPPKRRAPAKKNRTRAS